MSRTQVQNSSQIESIGFEIAADRSIADSLAEDMAEIGTIEIQFKNGGSVYRYFNVPLSTCRAMMAAESVGKFFYANIKGKFDYAKVEERALTLPSD